MVEVLDSRLIKAIDRLAHPSLTDVDTLQTVRGVRRMVGAKSILSLLMLDDDALQAPFPTFKSKQKEIGALKRQIDELREQKAALEQSNLALRQEKERLQDQMRLLEHAKPVPPAEPARQDTYSYEDVVKIILQRLGHLRGQRMWVSYSQQLRARDPNSPLVTTSIQAMWRRQNAFPAWAVQQLLDMPITAAEAHRWTEEDLEFLVERYNLDPFTTYDQLAADCSQRFGHLINENSIRTKLHLLRNLNRIKPRSKIR